jgi:hypothetical protein
MFCIAKEAAERKISELKRQNEHLRAKLEKRRAEELPPRMHAPAPAKAAAPAPAIAPVDP